MALNCEEDLCHHGRRKAKRTFMNFMRRHLLRRIFPAVILIVVFRQFSWSSFDFGTAVEIRQPQFWIIELWWRLFIWVKAERRLKDTFVETGARQVPTKCLFSQRAHHFSSSLLNKFQSHSTNWLLLSAATHLKVFVMIPLTVRQTPSKSFNKTLVVNLTANGSTMLRYRRCSSPESFSIIPCINLFKASPHPTLTRREGKTHRNLYAR